MNGPSAAAAFRPCAGRIPREDREGGMSLLELMFAAAIHAMSELSRADGVTVSRAIA
jgi:hypothetical protein